MKSYNSEVIFIQNLFKSIIFILIFGKYFLNLLLKNLIIFKIKSLI